MTAQYTDGIEKKVLHDNYLRLRIQEKQFLRRVRNSVRARRLPMELLLFDILFVVCLKESFSVHSIHTLPFTRFLCEYDILLEKDGKTDLAFGI